MLRLSEAEAADARRRGARRRRDDDHQHGSAAPVAPTACCASCSSSTARRCCARKPIIGYLHTGMEKTGEELTYVQGAHQRHPHGLRVAAVQRARLLARRRAAARHRGARRGRTWIRMLLVELNRMSSHLLFLATNGMDLGAVSMMLYGWREREEVLRFFEKVTGLRMNHNYIRPGGVAADLPDGWQRRRARAARHASPRAARRVRRAADRPARSGASASQGVGVITTEEALALGATGPILRSHRRRLGPAPGPALPRATTRSTSTSSSAATATASTATPSASTRSASRCKIVRQCVERMPTGDYRDPGQEGHAAAAGPHRRVDGGADPPLQALHRGLQGARGRDLRRGRVAPRRDRLLHRERRHRRSRTACTSAGRPS